jgi:hypothetical protein
MAQSKLMCPVIYVTSENPLLQQRSMHIYHSMAKKK